MKKFIAFLSLTAGLLCIGNANAGTINFNTCWSSCENIGTTQNGSISTVATLEYLTNGTNVDFTLTNSIANLYTGNSTTFLSELFFNFADGKAPTAIIDESSNIDSISIAFGAITNASLGFDVDVNLANSGGPNSLRIFNGDSATWTFVNFAIADLSLPAMAHFQALPKNDGSVKIISGVQNVPEPATLFLFSCGLLFLVFIQRQRALKNA